MASPQARASVRTPVAEAIDPNASTIEPRRRPKSHQACRQGRRERSRQIARMGFDRALCRDRRSGGEARSRSRRPLLHRLRGGLQGQAHRAGERSRCRPQDFRSGQAFRAARRSPRAARVLCRIDPRAEHGRSGPREILRRRAGAPHRRVDASPVLRARAQSPRRRQARRGDGRSRARLLPSVARGHPQGQALSARGSRRAALPREVGDRLFGLEPAVRRDHRAAALQGRHQVAGDRAHAQSAAGLARGEAQGGGAGAGGDVQGEPPPVHAHHQHARQGQGDFRSLARLRRRRGLAASVEPRRARGGRCAGDGGARRLSAALASLLRAQGALVRQEAAGALGPQRAAAEGRDPHHHLDRGAVDGADRLWRVLHRHGGDRREILQEQLDRRAGAARQGARRLRASDRAVGASVCAAQLPGQAARRDDARARARPRRASGAGGAERSA